MDYRRTVEQLEKLASQFWPPEIAQQEAELSVIPKLVESQDDFIAILGIKVSGIEDLFQIVNAAMLPASLFIKHLIVLADYGGEQLKRISSSSIYPMLFPQNTLVYYWRTRTDGLEERLYNFKAFPKQKLSNTTLRLNGSALINTSELTDLQKDAIAILLFGAASVDEGAANILAKCEIGEYLGQLDELEKFVRQRYIWVSRVTGGAQSNNLGQLAQRYVHDYVKENINVPDVGYSINGHVPGVSHVNDNRLTTFDLVVEHEGKYVAVEISFQVTTNSVIERKSGQARARYEQIEADDYKIAYVLDGAGNFERKSALQTICSYSHCTVAFSPNELDVLCDFIREYFKGRQ